MMLNNSSLLQDWSDYYNQISERSGTLTPRQRLDVLHSEMQHHIGELFYFTALLYGIDGAVWQTLFDGCDAFLDQFPKQIIGIRDLVAEKCNGNGAAPTREIEALRHSIPDGPFALLMACSLKIADRLKDRRMIDLPDECECWAENIAETIIKMRVLTQALVGKRW